MNINPYRNTKRHPYIYKINWLQVTGHIICCSTVSLAFSDTSIIVASIQKLTILTSSRKWVAMVIVINVDS